MATNKLFEIDKPKAMERIAYDGASLIIGIDPGQAWGMFSREFSAIPGCYTDRKVQGSAGWPECYAALKRLLKKTQHLVGSPAVICGCEIWHGSKGYAIGTSDRWLGRLEIALEERGTGLLEFPPGTWKKDSGVGGGASEADYHLQFCRRRGWDPATVSPDACAAYGIFLATCLDYGHHLTATKGPGAAPLTRITDGLGVAVQ